MLIPIFYVGHLTGKHYTKAQMKFKNKQLHARFTK